MWRRDILHSRNDQVVTALKEDLAANSQTIFERLFSRVLQDPWVTHWTTFDRKATCRFDCAPPKVDQILEGTYFQSYPDEVTKLVCKLYTRAPGEAGHCVRTLEKGEVVGPAAGPAKRRVTRIGDFASVPVVGDKTEGSPIVWLNIWGPSAHSPPRGQAAGGGWGAMFALP
eukprot:4012086-Pyramimonas_sp.AAC.1